MSQTRNIMIGLIAGFLFFIIPAIVSVIAYKLALAFDFSETQSYFIGGLSALCAFAFCIYQYLAYCRRNDST